MMKKLLATMVVLVGMTGVAAAQYPPPPALYQEVVPVLPSPRHVWQPGHWQWNGYNYIWVRGHYIIVEPRFRHRHWVHGHWEQGPNGWYWVPAGWR